MPLQGSSDSAFDPEPLLAGRLIRESVRRQNGTGKLGDGHGRRGRAEHAQGFPEQGAPLEPGIRGLLPAGRYGAAVVLGIEQLDDASTERMSPARRSPSALFCWMRPPEIGVKADQVADAWWLGCARNW